MFKYVNITALVFFLGLALTDAVSADEIAVSERGKIVVLKEDGRWEVVVPCDATLSRAVEDAEHSLWAHPAVRERLRGRSPGAVSSGIAREILREVRIGGWERYRTTVKRIIGLSESMLAESDKETAYEKKARSVEEQNVERLLQTTVRPDFIRPKDVTDIIDFFSDTVGVSIIVNTGAFEDREVPPRIRARFDVRLRAALDYIVREAGRPGHPLAWRVMGKHVWIDHPEELDNYRLAEKPDDPMLLPALRQVMEPDFYRHRPITEIADYIFDRTGISVLINTGAFEHRERPPVVRARFRASLRDTLDHVVREGSRPGHPLAWKFDGEHIWIGHPDEL